METLIEDILAVLLELGPFMPRVFIFCRQYDECSAMYRSYKHFFGNKEENITQYGSTVYTSK